MRKTLVIAKRDFIAVVQTKAFLLSLILPPLICAGSYLPVALQMKHPDTKGKTIAIVDYTAQAAPAVTVALRRQNERDLYDKTTGLQIMPRYQFETVQPDGSDPALTRLTLSDRVRRRDLFAFIEIGPQALDPMQHASIDWFAGEGETPETEQWIGSAVNDGLRQVRLSHIGVDPAKSAEALLPVTLQKMGLVTRDPKTGKIAAPQKRGIFEFLIPVLSATMFMMIVMLTAAPMLTAISEDKMQRVFEMLLVSATPFELISGKVLAAVARSLTSALVVMLAALVALYMASVLGLAPLHILPWFFVYVIAEVTILAALAAALGSACSTPQDASSFSWVLLIPIMLPFFVAIRILNEPNGNLALGMSLFPLFTPVAMLVRQLSPGSIPPWQPWVGLVGVALATVAISWFAARIFRIGILLQGKPPKLADLMRWALRG
jgi:ABC-2 type transport system permease protein